MAVLNFTGRKAIDRNLIEIRLERDACPLSVYLKTDAKLRENQRFAGCIVILEAYLRTKSQRKELGRLVDLSQSVAIVFGDFPSAEDVLFRVKIVNPENRRIAGIVEGLKERTPKEPKTDLRKRKTLLPVNWAAEGDNLMHRFWKVSFSGVKPTLLIRRGKFTTLGAVNQPEFQSLAFPSILREVLHHAFITRFDNPPSWAEDWEKMAYLLDGTPRPELPDGEGKRSALQDYFEETAEWIDTICEKFASDCRLNAIDSQFKRI